MDLNDMVNEAVSGFEALLKRAQSVRKAFACLGDRDAIAVVLVNDAREAGMIAQMAASMKDEPKSGILRILSGLFGKRSDPSPGDRLADCVFTIMVFEKGGRDEICCQRVVENEHGEFEVTSDFEPFGQRRGPMVLLIPKNIVQHVQKDPSIWNRVTITF